MSEAGRGDGDTAAGGRDALPYRGAIQQWLGHEPGQVEVHGDGGVQAGESQITPSK